MHYDTICPDANSSFSLLYDLSRQLPNLSLIWVNFFTFIWWHTRRAMNLRFLVARFLLATAPNIAFLRPTACRRFTILMWVAYRAAACRNGKSRMVHLNNIENVQLRSANNVQTKHSTTQTYHKFKFISYRHAIIKKTFTLKTYREKLRIQWECANRHR